MEGILCIAMRKSRTQNQKNDFSGLERSKLKQMTLQFIQNAGEDGTMRDGMYMSI